MGNIRKETAYREGLIDRIELMFPDCVVMKNDPDQLQGIPDLLILFENKWAMLEVKRSVNEPTQPNQPYYVEKFNEMSFAAFIYPENEEEVLEQLLLRLGS